MFCRIRSGYVLYVPIFVMFLQMRSFVYDPSPVLSMFRQRSCSAQYVLSCSGLVCQFSIYVLFLICLMSMSNVSVLSSVLCIEPKTEQIDGAYTEHVTSIFRLC